MVGNYFTSIFAASKASEIIDFGLQIYVSVSSWARFLERKLREKHKPAQDGQ